MLLWTFSGWVNRHQQDVIAYLVEENRVLKEQMKGRRLRLTDEQRRRLAAKAKRLGRKTLNRVATIVTPDTITRWHRRLIALKWTCESFIAQVARNLTDAVDGFLMGYRFLICDRDSKFSEPFRRILQGAGVGVIRAPIQAPNCNSYAERAHQGLGNNRIDNHEVTPEGEIRCRERLGGILKHYCRAA